MSIATTQTRNESSGIIPPLFQRDGPLTAELLLEPARFGLGLLPQQSSAGAIVAVRLRLLLHRLQSQHPSARRRSRRA